MILSSGMFMNHPSINIKIILTTDPVHTLHTHTQILLNMMAFQVIISLNLKSQYTFKKELIIKDEEYISLFQVFFSIILNLGVNSCEMW